MDFAGAVWNLRPTVQPPSAIAFHIHSADTSGFRVLALHMAAFRRAAETLKRYDSSLEPLELLPNVSARQLFPHPKTYTSLIDDTEKENLYQRPLSKDSDQLIFFSSEGPGGGDRICVKFVQ